MSVTGHPIVIRRAEAGDAEAIHSTFCGPKAMAGTLQIPYASVEMWRKRLADFPPDDHLLVATIAGEVVGNLEQWDAAAGTYLVRDRRGELVRVPERGVRFGKVVS